MSDREFLIRNFQPVLLGDSKRAREIASALHRKYGIVSYICDEKRWMPTVFSCNLAFWRVCGCAFPELLCEQLEHIASFDAECIYVLVPVSKQYCRFLNENSKMLEKTFVVRQVNNIFENIPLTENLNKKFNLEGDSHVFE